MDIKALSKTKAKEFKALSTKKERDRRGLFLAEGEKCVKDTLGAFNLEYLIATHEWISTHREIAKENEKVLYSADKNTIALISSLSSLPDVIAIFKTPSPLNLTPILDKDKLYLLLDEIQDPGNLGTIIRTCDWFGVYDIYASKNTVDVFGPKVVQATMGSLSRVRLHYVDLEDLILKNRGIQLIGTLLEGVKLQDANLKSHGMLLMGNEGRGISENLKKYIDIPLTIPPFNPLSHPDSLNVSIAVAVVLSSIQLKDF